MAPARDDQTLSVWAHAYAERGWPVFPLRPRDKTPLTRTGFKAASTDAALIDAWWDFYPDANIGLPTGLSFDVLDVDGEEGLDALRVYWGRKTYKHNGPVAGTGRGWHLLFPVTGYNSSAGLLGHVDFRGKGGYIVAPPSVHPSGSVYHWVREAPLSPPPPWLTTLLAEHGTKPSTYERKAIIANDPTRPYLEAIAQILPDQLPRQTRNELTREPIMEVAEAMQLPISWRGRYAVTQCIFDTHSDTTPSLTLFPNNNDFYCFGCGVSGDSTNLRNRTHR